MSGAQFEPQYCPMSRYSGSSGCCHSAVLAFSETCHAQQDSGRSSNSSKPLRILVVWRIADSIADNVRKAMGASMLWGACGPAQGHRPRATPAAQFLLLLFCPASSSTQLAPPLGQQCQLVCGPKLEGECRWLDGGPHTQAFCQRDCQPRGVGAWCLRCTSERGGAIRAGFPY